MTIETDQGRAARILPWVSLVARLVLGASFLVAGGRKMADLAQSVIAVKGYQFPIPPVLETTLGYALPIVEILVGLVIVAGLFRRWGAAIGGVFMLAYIGVIISAWARGLTIDCGCFTPGGMLAPGQATAYAQDILRDSGFLVCAVWLVIRPESPWSLDGWLRAPVDKEA